MKRLLICLALLTLSVNAAIGATFSGQVVRVSDGDTIVVLIDHRQVKVRLHGIDTPERAQPWGRQAAKALAHLVAGRDVDVEQTDTDRYGRVVGKVYVDNLDVNRQLVADGHAWVYRKYSKDPGLLSAEAAARKDKRGLWTLPEAERVPPWEWRKAQRDKK